MSSQRDIERRVAAAECEQPAHECDYDLSLSTEEKAILDAYFDPEIAMESTE